MHLAEQRHRLYVSEMTNYLIYALIGAVVVIIVESGIWMNACLGLSMRHKEADFTEMMFRAPYRVFWPPKLLVGIAEIGSLCAAAKYYRSGGQELTLAVASFALLVLFGVLVFWESSRAIARYEELRN